MVNLTKKQEEKIEKEVELKLYKKLYNKTKGHASGFGEEFKKQSLIAVTAAFAFLVALSWREPISKLVKGIVEKAGLGKQIVYYEFLAAVLVTLIAIIVLVMVSKWNSKKVS